MLLGFLLGLQFSCLIFSIACLVVSIKEEKIKKAKRKKLEDLIIKLWGDLDEK